MTESLPSAAVPAICWDELSVIRDGDCFIVGSHGSPDFVAVPEIGAEVLGWLARSLSVEEVHRRASERAGQDVDVFGFVADLAASGVLPLIDTTDPTHRRGRSRPPAGHRLGGVLFGRTGLLVQLGLALVGLVLLVVSPALRPTWSDAFVVRAPLASMLIMAGIATASGLGHELAHVLSAAGRGVPSRISMGRRLFVLVYQTDLTQLWRLPRRSRAVPLVAGMLSDLAIAGLLLIIDRLGLTVGWPATAQRLVAAVVLVKVTGVLFQAEVFMRTDLYALFALGTGSRNLWATKGAVARRLIGRADADDDVVLATMTAREIRWARVYLLLYVPGVAWTTWYFIAFALPGARRILSLATEDLVSAGPVSLTGAAAVVALLLALIPLVIGLVGTLRSATAVLRRTVAHRRRSGQR